MPAVEWPFTRLGLTFFDGTLPKLVRALERIAVVMEKDHVVTEQRVRHAIRLARNNVDKDIHEMSEDEIVTSVMGE